MTPIRLEADAFLFDNDGVLVDSAGAVEKAWLRLADAYDLDPVALLAHVHGRPSRVTVEEFVAAPLRAEALALVDRLEREWGAAVSAMPGAVDCVSGLGDHEWAIVTSGTTDLSTARLRAAGVPIPPTLVTADHVRHGKPAPDAYLAAAAGLGVPPDRCVVFEDAAPGVEAARAAGIGYVVGVGTHAATLGADAAVPDLRSVHIVSGAALVGRAS